MVLSVHQFGSIDPLPELAAGVTPDSLHVSKVERRKRISAFTSRRSPTVWATSARTSTLVPSLLSEASGSAGVVVSVRLVMSKEPVAAELARPKSVMRSLGSMALAPAKSAGSAG